MKSKKHKASHEISGLSFKDWEELEDIKYKADEASNFYLREYLRKKAKKFNKNGQKKFIEIEPIISAEEYLQLRGFSCLRELKLFNTQIYSQKGEE